MRLVSQCASATRCERNWSTFAFIHTKVHNRLTYEKLHNLVYVNYNLRIQNSIDGGFRHDDDDDPFNRLMELTLVDTSNPIREWMECARSTVQPELDEESPDTDAPTPSAMVTDTADPRDLQRRTGSSSISEWTRRNIGDSQRGKSKTYAMQPKRQSKRLKGKKVIFDGTTEDENNPTYEESNDSSSRTDSDDGNDGDDTGGGTASLAAIGSHEQPLPPFTADQFTHCTQDRDHGGPTSPRILSRTANAPADSSGSSSHGIDDVPIPGPYTYHVPDIQSQPSTRWVYEWIDSELYNMCYQDWRGTAEWTRFTWQEYKSHLLQTQCIILISTDEYYAMQNAQPI
jgi:hypothetical protein